MIPSARAKLERYLAVIESEYQRQPEGERTATLATCGDGGISVRAIAQAIKLRQTQEKYRFERGELFPFINSST